MQACYLGAQTQGLRNPNGPQEATPSKPFHHFSEAFLVLKHRNDIHLLAG